MAELLLAPLIVFAVLSGWVGVERLYARFQARHPQLGPFRDLECGCTCCHGPAVGSCVTPTAGEQGAGSAHAVAESVWNIPASNLRPVCHRQPSETGRQEGGAPLCP